MDMSLIYPSNIASKSPPLPHVDSEFALSWPATSGFVCVAGLNCAQTLKVSNKRQVHNCGDHANVLKLESSIIPVQKKRTHSFAHHI